MDTTPPTPDYPENQLEAMFLDRVRKRLHGTAHKFAPINRGNPDRIVLLPGGNIEFVELKTKRGKLSDIQKIWHERAAALGITVAVLHGIDEIDQWVAEWRATIWPDEDTVRQPYGKRHGTTCAEPDCPTRVRKKGAYCKGHRDDVL